jgi:DNA polymerase III psi subunit
MFSNLTLYYLNQLGITPWISKENVTISSTKPNPVESRVFKLVVLISADLTGKAKSLFDRMLAYINIQDNEFLLLNIKQEAFSQGANSQWFAQIDNSSPVAVLALGLNTKTIFNDSNPTYAVVESLAIDQLLNNPSNKKQVFQDLSYLKQLLS